MIFLIAVAILIFDKTTSALGIFSYFGLNTNNSISKEIEDGSPTPEIPVAEITFEEDESLESVQIEEQTVVTPTPTPAITPNPVAKPSSTFTPNPTTLPAPASTSVPEANIDLNLERVEISEDSTIETRSESNWATSSTTGVFKSNLGIGVTWFAIRNNGHEDAKNVQVKVIVDQKTITTFNIGIIQKQEVNYWSETDIQYPKDLGIHKVEFQVNPEKTINETRYDNNSLVVHYQFVD